MSILYPPLRVPSILVFLGERRLIFCMQDTFARATHSAYAAGRPSTARDEGVSCIQVDFLLFNLLRPGPGATRLAGGPDFFENYSL